MPVQRTSIRVVPTATPSRTVPAQRPTLAASGQSATRLDTTELDAFKNRVVKAVSYAQQAQAKLESVSRDYNAGTATRAAFDEAEAAFKVATTELRGLKVEGKRHNAPFWRPSGFKIDRFFKESGAQALLDYRPPTLGAPEQPAGPTKVFDVKLAALRQAADDAVNIEADLTALLADATADQVKQLLVVGRKGRRIALNSDYYTECSPAFFAKAHARLEAIAAPQTFEARLALVQQAAEDAVRPEPRLSALLKEATTPAQLDRLLAVGRKGARIAIRSDYYTECSQAWFTEAHARREALTPPRTFADKVASVKQAASDTVNPGPRLIALLAEATTTDQVEHILEAAREGSRIAIRSEFFTACPEAVFAAAHARREAIAPPRTLADRLASLQRAASDTVNPEKALMALLDDAQTPAQVEQILNVGRKGRRIAIGSQYYTASSEALFAKGHTRLLQMALTASVPTVSAPDRVKFALQPLPTFDTHESYRNYAVKSAAYALVEMAELRGAREAFKAGTLTERALHEVEDRLELSLKLVSALQAHVKPGQAAAWRADGFDVQAFWDKYQIEASAKQLLG